LIKRTAVAWSFVLAAFSASLAASLQEIKDICKCTSHDCQKELFSLLADDDAYVRTYAASCLEKQKSIDSEMLKEAVNSKSARVLVLALRISAKHGSCEDPLDKYLEHELPAVRAQAAYAIGELGCERFESNLSDMTWDRNISVRAQVIDALGKLGKEASLKKIVVFLNSPHDQVAQAAIRACVRYEDRAVAPLKELVSNGERAELRVRAALALGAITTPAATQALLEVLESRDKDAVGAALYTLKFRKDKSLIPQIMKYLYDNTEFGRYGKLSELAKAALENQRQPQ